MHNSLSFNIGNFAVALFENNRFLSRFNMQVINTLEWDIYNKNDFMQTSTLQHESLQKITISPAIAGQARS